MLPFSQKKGEENAHTRINSRDCVQFVHAETQSE